MCIDNINRYEFMYLSMLIEFFYFLFLILNGAKFLPLLICILYSKNKTKFLYYICFVLFYLSFNRTTTTTAIKPVLFETILNIYE